MMGSTFRVSGGEIFFFFFFLGGGGVGGGNIVFLESCFFCVLFFPRGIETLP